MAEPANNIHHNQTLYDWLTGTPIILNFRQAPKPLPPPPRYSKRISIMPFQTLSTKQSEVAEFGITRLSSGAPVKKNYFLCKFNKSWMEE